MRPTTLTGSIKCYKKRGHKAPMLSEIVVEETSAVIFIVTHLFEYNEPDSKYNS